MSSFSFLVAKYSLFPETFVYEIVAYVEEAEIRLDCDLEQFDELNVDEV